MVSELRPAVLLVSSDRRLAAELQGMLSSIGLALNAVTDSERALAKVEDGGSEGGFLLLDSRLPGVANGRLLAALHEHGAHRCWAIALLAEHVADEWIERLREGVIDDIVPYNASADAWKRHMGTMQRGHSLYCEVEYLRETSQIAVKHDPVTGAPNRDTLLTILFRETDRVQRLQGALSVIAIGVDQFEHWQEGLGRDGANQALREVVRRTSRALRTYDAIGRLGHGELLLILPGCSAVNAVMLAERLRVEVFGESFWIKRRPNDIVEVRFTGSFGITMSRGRSPVVVMREAEQALEAACRQGPGTIRSASDTAAGSERTDAARLFPEAETVTW